MLPLIDSYRLKKNNVLTWELEFFPILIQNINLKKNTVFLGYKKVSSYQISWKKFFCKR